MNNLDVFLKNRLKTHKCELIKKENRTQLAEEYRHYLWQEESINVTWESGITISKKIDSSISVLCGIGLLDKNILDYLKAKMKIRK